MNWISPVQVRLVKNHTQNKESQNINSEAVANTSGGAVATMAGSTPTQPSVEAPQVAQGTQNSELLIPLDDNAASNGQRILSLQ